MPRNTTRWYPRWVQYSYMASPEQPREILDAYVQAIDLLETEFFRFSPKTFSKFCGLFQKKNGDQARHEVEEKYQAWRNKTQRVPAKLIKRILECVPPCLSRENQFKLIACQIPSVLHQQKTALKLDTIYTSQLTQAYQTMVERIKIHDVSMEWFLNDLFSQADLAEFTSVFTFTMLDRLQQSFGQVHQDLAHLFEFLPRVDCCVDFQYRISLLGCNVKLDSPPGPYDLDFFNLPQEPALVTEYKKQYQEILLDHGLKQFKEKIEGEANQKFALYDISQVVDKLSRISHRQQYETTLYLRGSGGMMTLHLQKKNLNTLRLHMAFQVFKLILIPGLLVFSGLGMVKFTVLAPVLMVLDLILIYMMRPIWETLAQKNTEVKEYEQKRTKWLAAVGD